ncbi:MAG: TatD family hydrolase, partial [Candidatus Gallimonas sp.]
DKRKQREAFHAQITLAEEAGLPVQIHSRDCAADMLALLRERKDSLSRGFLLHCYSHGRDAEDEFLSLGAYLSFGGVVCFKNARKVVESAAACPIDRILSETDSPYLSPVRGEKNTPANIPAVLRRLAEIRGASFESMKESIRKNALRLFPKLS